MTSSADHVDRFGPDIDPSLRALPKQISTTRDGAEASDAELAVRRAMAEHQRHYRELQAAPGPWAFVRRGYLVDPEVFEEFYTDTLPMLQHHLIRLGALFEEARDLAQEALVEVYQRRREIECPNAYATTVARNLFYRARKAAARFEQTAAAEYGGLAARHDGPEEQMVRETIAALPGLQRRVLALRYDGYTPTEIAELLGTTPNNVRVTLHHTRAKLRAQVAGKEAVKAA
ncbi:MAG: hypothetical protein JWP34_4472 [Massilia sp.]|jgi:RNA polymerase sigma factor (sigma-70 family)|nr:hypothetical protein [Massilia sp.]